MIIATGTNGTIGSHFSESVKHFDYRKYIKNKTCPKFNSEFTFIHAAGIVGESQVTKNISEAFEINVNSTIRLASELLEQDLRKFIYVSSAHVYQNSIHKLHENSPVCPTSNYAAQKLEAERGLMEIFEKYPEKLSILRLFSVLNWDAKPGSLGFRIQKASLDPTEIILNADDVRDFLHPKQVAQTVMQVANQTDIPTIVNVCSGKAITVKRAAISLARTRKLTIRDEQFVVGNSPMPHIVGDNTRLLALLSESSINPDLSLS